MTKKIIWMIVIIGLLTGVYLIFINRVKIRERFDLWYRRNTLPPAQEFILPPKNNRAAPLTTSAVQKNQASKIPAVALEEKSAPPVEVVTPKTESFPPATSSVVSAAADILPEEINLAVPFVSQAPFRNWDAVHNETCEEASVLMVNGFYKKEKYTRQEMEDNLLSLVDWQKEKFGFFEDTNVEETAQMMREYYGLSGATVVYDITIEDIKKELAAGNPVIVPAAGKLLPNPYFRNGGPVYHMLVLKGYTKDGKFISNDPGTNTLGENFTYKFDALYNAIHDWIKDGDILTGRKVMIVVE